MVKMEKNLMRSMELVSRERMEAAVCSIHSEKVVEYALTVSATTLNLG
jgi:hypothetical protein